jgi:class 3 adenylate cyclase
MSDEAESRVAAVMVADVVGYHHLMEADEEEATVAAMRTLRTDVLDPSFAAHHGTIAKLIEDEIVAVFGSAADAARCAAAIQAGLKSRQEDTAPDRRIVLRMGIDVGEVRAEGDGVGGEGVALATRLKDLCEPGGVLVSAAAQDQIPGTPQVVIDDAGTQRGENGAEPVHAYEVRLAKSLAYQPAARRSINPFVISAVAVVVGVVAALLYEAVAPRTPRLEGESLETQQTAVQEAPAASDESDEWDPNVWGVLDGIRTDGNLGGWAVDIRDPSEQLAVYLYISGEDPTGRLPGFSDCLKTTGGERNEVCGAFTFIGDVVADEPYEMDADLPDRVKRGDHGFSFAVPGQFRDGAAHFFYAYVIQHGHEDEVDALRGGANPDGRSTVYLYQSPRSATLN